MTTDTQSDMGIMSEIEKISEFMDGTVFSRITGKITDYSDLLTEQKLSSLINFKYDLSSGQVNGIIGLLLKIRAISIIYTIATKGMRDLEAEYISNIFSRTDSPSALSSYTTIRTIIENRLSTQVQNYNINMNKPGSTLAIPVSELRGHVKSHAELKENRALKSSKIQHGMIAASLHDAIVILLNTGKWRDDKAYIKFFTGDTGYSHTANLLLIKSEWVSLERIRETAELIPRQLDEIIERRNPAIAAARQGEERSVRPAPDIREVNEADDKMSMTPFGKQYGGKIDGLIGTVFTEERYVIFASIGEEALKKKIAAITEAYGMKPGKAPEPAIADDMVNLADFLLGGGDSVKSFAEKYPWAGKKTPFSVFFGENREKIDEFLTTIFMHFFEVKFAPLFKIIKSQDLRKFACAYILKRIQLKKGESLPPFGHYLMKAIGRSCGIKA